VVLWREQPKRAADPEYLLEERRHLESRDDVAVQHAVHRPLGSADRLRQLRDSPGPLLKRYPGLSSALVEMSAEGPALESRFSHAAILGLLCKLVKPEGCDVIPAHIG
jgi:hypothetical protein